MHVEAVNGAVTVRDASGELEASTVNGKLTVPGGSFTRAQLETVSGRVRFEGASPRRPRSASSRVSGPVELSSPRGFGADFT